MERSLIADDPSSPRGEIVEDCTELKNTFINFWKERKDNDRFPAPQPVSLSRSELKSKVNHYNYYVSVKSDGERFLLFLTKHNGKNSSLMINRKFEFFTINFVFDPSLYDTTLFDGELIQNKTKTKWLYIIHDCLALSGTELYNENLTNRYQKIPLLANKLEKIGEYNKLLTPPIYIRSKKFVTFKNMKDIVEYSNSSDLDHHTDGYIFTPVDPKVGMYTQFTLFKWKRENTFDFKIVEENSNLFAIIRYNNELFKFASISINCDKGKCFKNELIHLGFEDGNIVECVYNTIEETFHPYRLRKDKSIPNDYKVVKKTLENIKEDITEKDILETAAAIKN